MRKFLPVLLCFLLSANVGASVFEPKSGTIEFFNLSNFLDVPSITTPLFSIHNSGEDPNLAVKIPLNFDPFTGAMLPGDQISFAEVDPGLGGGFAYRNDDFSPSIILPTPHIEVAWFDGVDWLAPTSTNQSGPQAFELLFGRGLAGITINDVDQIAAIPIPSAALLFGSGLIGFTAIARRKTKNEHGFAA